MVSRCRSCGRGADGSLPLPSAAAAAAEQPAQLALKIAQRARPGRPSPGPADCPRGCDSCPDRSKPCGVCCSWPFGESAPATGGTSRGILGSRPVAAQGEHGRASSSAFLAADALRARAGAGHFDGEASRRPPRASERTAPAAMEPRACAAVRRRARARRRADDRHPGALRSASRSSSTSRAGLRRQPDTARDAHRHRIRRAAASPVRSILL